MRRAKILVIVGIIVFVGGLLMPAVFVTEKQGCAEYNSPDEDGSACAQPETGQNVGPNPFRGPTIATGFVIGIVGISLWGLDLDEE